MKVLLHADDFGLTKKVTDDILECIDADVINSVSVMVNGHAFEYAMEEILKRKGKVEIALHLNLDQGRAISPSGSLKDLVDHEHFLHAGFERLFLRYYIASRKKKSEIQKELRVEIGAQIDKLLPYLKKMGQPLRIDSERCVHMLPVVFNILVDIAPVYNISFIRIAKEPLYFYLRGMRDIKYYMGSNIFKNILMQYMAFAGNYKDLLTAANIHFSEIIFGLIHGSDIDLELTDFYIKYAARRKMEMVQVVFHPFVPDRSELHFWDNYEAYKRFFASKRIPSEKNYLISGQVEFHRLLRSG